MTESKRSTFYRADRDDQTGEVTVITKRRVNCPEGYETTRNKANKALQERESWKKGKETADKIKSDPPGTIAKEVVEKYHEEDPEVRRADDDVPEGDDDVTEGTLCDEPILGTDIGMLVAKGVAEDKFLGRVLVEIRLVAIRRNYTHFEVESTKPDGRTTVMFGSAHVPNRKGVFFDWKNPRRLHPTVRKCAEKILSDEKVQDFYNDVMLAIRSGRRDPIEE